MRDGLAYTCKTCNRERLAKYYIDNTEKIKNRSKIAKTDKQLARYATDIEYRDKIDNKLLREISETDTHKICTKCKVLLPKSDFYKQTRNNLLLMPTCISCNKIQGKLWASNNKDIVRAKAKRWANKRIENLIHKRMSNAIWQVLRKNKRKTTWLKYVDFTAPELYDHLEKQFTDGMTWDLFKVGKIHIDHIILKSWFVFDTPDDIEFRKCWSLDNLQPMWAEENCSKNNKYSGKYRHGPEN